MNGSIAVRGPPLAIRPSLRPQFMGRTIRQAAANNNIDSQSSDEDLTRQSTSALIARLRQEKIEDQREIIELRARLNKPPVHVNPEVFDWTSFALISSSPFSYMVYSSCGGRFEWWAFWWLICGCWNVFVKAFKFIANLSITALFFCRFHLLSREEQRRV